MGAAIPPSRPPDGFFGPEARADSPAPDAVAVGVAPPVDDANTEPAHIRMSRLDQIDVVDRDRWAAGAAEGDAFAPTAHWTADGREQVIGNSSLMDCLKRARAQGWVPVIQVCRTTTPQYVRLHALLLIATYPGPFGRNVTGFLVRRATSGPLPPDMAANAFFGVHGFTHRRVHVISGEHFQALRDRAILDIRHLVPGNRYWLRRLVHVDSTPRAAVVVHAEAVPVVLAAEDEAPE